MALKNTLLIVGCGDIALRTAPLLQTHFRVLGLCRSPENFTRLRSHGIIPLSGNLDHKKSLDKLAGIAQVVIHLAPPPNHGKHDTRTTNLLAALIRRPKREIAILPQRLVYISTSGVYGNCNGALIDETHPVNPGNDRALRRVNAENQIRAWGVGNHVNASILRVPGIYAGNRLPLVRVQEGKPMLSAEDDSYTNHIHADDLAQIIYAAIRHAKPNRIYHTCDDSHLKMGEYFDLVADKFNLPHPPRISRNQASGHISPGMLSYLDESRRLDNLRMKKELRIKLNYPIVAEGIYHD